MLEVYNITTHDKQTYKPKQKMGVLRILHITTADVDDTIMVKASHPPAHTKKTFQEAPIGGGIILLLIRRVTNKAWTDASGNASISERVTECLLKLTIVAVNVCRDLIGDLIGKSICESALSCPF